MLDKFQTLAEGLDHPEGVAVGPDGRLYAGGEAGQVYEVGFDGTIDEIANTGGFVLGLAVDGDSNLYCCDMARAAVVRVDGSTRTVETFSTGSANERMRTPNYPAFDTAGNLYVTDSGEFAAEDGLVFRISANGDAEVWTRDVKNFPNGCCVGPDGASLYVAVSTPQPGVVRVPIMTDGSAGVPEPIVGLEGTVPDGVTITDDGAVLVSCYRPDRIYLVGPDGTAETLVDDPQGVVLSAPTNTVFAGENRDRLVVSSLGRWHLSVGDIGLRGQPLAYPNLPNYGFRE